MGSERKTVHLGTYGQLPLDQMFEMFFEMADGRLLTIFQTRLMPTLGAWVYDAAALLAKYLEILSSNLNIASNYTDNFTLKGRSLLDLGAGTGVVGIVAACLGANVILTDFESLVPLCNLNSQTNSKFVTGSISSLPLVWGDDDMMDAVKRSAKVDKFDIIVLANCVYYESSLEVLLQTVLSFSNAETVIFASYEQRTEEIGRLLDRWHALASQHFNIEHLEKKLFDRLLRYEDFVRLSVMTLKT